jgi:hypothetical protein
LHQQTSLPWNFQLASANGRQQSKGWHFSFPMALACWLSPVTWMGCILPLKVTTSVLQCSFIFSPPPSPPLPPSSFSLFSPSSLFS